MKLTIFDLDNTILKEIPDYSWINYLIDLSKVDKKSMKKKTNTFMTSTMRETLIMMNGQSLLCLQLKAKVLIR